MPMSETTMGIIARYLLAKTSGNAHVFHHFIPLNQELSGLIKLGGQPWIFDKRMGMRDGYIGIYVEATSPFVEQESIPHFWMSI